MSKHDALSTKDNKRIERALKVGFVSDLAHWAETGDNSGLEYYNDNSRSGLEYQLARQGWFWVGDRGWEAVISWMNHFNPPKWEDSKPESEYRKATIENSRHEKRYNPTFEKSDFHVSQEATYDVMITLSMKGKAKTSELAEETKLSKSTVSRAIDYLIKRGVVVHERNGRENYYKDAGILQLSPEDLLSDLNPYEARLEWCRQHL